MSKQGQKVLADALRLSERERLALVEGILESVEPPPSTHGERSEMWLGEIERRARAALGGEPGMTWEAARTEIESRLAAREAS